MPNDGLPDEIPDDPVVGDGIISFPVPDDGDDEMAVDLSENVANSLLTETVGNIQATNNNGRNIANIAMGSLQAGVARTHNEIGAEESRAVSGVMATPVASPAVQTGA